LAIPINLPMSLNLKALRCFAVLAEELNFSRAAARVSLSQPAFSSQIRALEDRLGFSLFDRTTRQVALSTAGERFLPPVRRLLAASQSVETFATELRGTAPRRVVFGAAFYTLDIPERVRLLERFFHDRPDVPMDVVPAWQNQILPELQRGHMDVALLIGVAIPRSQYALELSRNPGVETVFPDDLPRLVLRRERVKLLVPAESSLAQGRTVPRETLGGAQVAMIGPQHGHAFVDPILQMLEQAGAEAIVPPEPHAIGVERYARQFRIPAISLGWFSNPEASTDMIALPIPGFDHSTELSLVSAPGGPEGAAEVLWNFAASLVG
jgi:DNA-binding transcriptional LysR family regulator